MNWTTIIFTSSAVICLTLTAFYFSVWIRQRDAWEYLLFSFAGIAAVMLSILEMNLLLAPTPSAYGEILRWMHVSSGMLMVAMAWFLRIYLNAGRDWLAWMVTGLRFLILLPNFLFYPNATFSEISEIRHVLFLGETFSIPTGAMNPWRILIDVSTLLFLLFVLDATVTAWKRGGRSRALTLGGTIVLVVVLSRISAELMSRGILPGTFISLCFLLIVVVMAHELSLDLLRARKLAIDLRESQQRMELAGAAASLEMWEWDVLKDEIWATRSTDRLAGIDAADHIKFDQYLETVHPDDQEALREVISQALDKDKDKDKDRDLQTAFRTMSPGGQIRWLSVCGKVEYGLNGKPLLIRGVSLDVTESKTAEIELKQNRSELAHISRISSLGQLSSALAHEINQPLGAILRNTEVAELFLKKTPSVPDELIHIIKDIRTDSQRAISVISRMRSLLQRQEMKFESLAVDELIGQVRHILNSELQARHVELLVEISNQLPPVYGDHIHLQQVILNLLLNSLDAFDESTGENRKIFIRASQIEDGMIQIVLSDNGTGIKPEKLPHLFEPFFTTREDGMGIGLAISKTIVEMHGGKITAENSPRGGAVVRFTLKAGRSGETQA